MKLWKFHIDRAGASIVALVVLVIFLMATTLSEVERRKEADKKRDQLISEIDKSNHAIADLVADYLIKVEAFQRQAEAAGKQAGITRDEFLDSLRSALPAEVIEEAVEIAKRGGQPGPQGPTGPQGPPGKQGSAGTSTTTSTVRAVTTTTIRPPATTTTSTTRPPRPCTVGLLGVCVRIGE